MISTKHVTSSRLPAPAPTEPVDRLSALLARFRLSASLFHSGALCGRTVFDAQPGRAFLHVLRRGELEVRHREGGPTPRRLRLSQPTLLLYPRAVHHEFINPPRDGSDFTCATLDFDGGERNPFVIALPPLVVVPLSAVTGLGVTLDLLFEETDRARCGSRLLADRLFEVVLIQLLRWLIDHPQAAGVHAGLLTGLGDARLARALVALHRAPQEDWPLSRMAATAGMSRSAFALAFKAAMGTTPAAYLTDWRLSLATTRLRQGWPHKRVAAELGFATASSLSRAFRQSYGASPRDWLAGELTAGPSHPLPRPAPAHPSATITTVRNAGHARPARDGYD